MNTATAFTDKGELMSEKNQSETLKSFGVATLLKLVRLEAEKRYDGLYTIFASATEYKVAFGSPDLETGKGREQVANVEGHPTLKEALIAALVESKSFIESEVEFASELPM